MESAALDSILTRHKEWLESNGERGERADLSGADLRSVPLSCADLRQAILVRVDLEGAHLADVRLSGADLTEARLTRAHLERVDLREARLVNADLEAADLSTVRHLKGTQLGGCNVAFVTWPPGFDIPGLELAKESARNYGVQLVSLLMACLYSWLTIGSAERLDLITNASATFFPFLEVSLPLVGFYFVAPLILFALYLSFYLHLEILWERLASLPAVFPDGLNLAQKVDPPLVDVLIERQMLHIHSDPRQRGGSSRVRLALAFIIVNRLVPVTLAFYWLTYLPRHEPLGTALHLVLLFASLAASRIFWLTLRRTLQRRISDVRLRRRLPLFGWGATLVAVVALSWGVLAGPRLPWGDFFYVDLSYQEISTPRGEGGGDGSDPDGAPSQGARLAGRNLRFGRLEGAFLVQADLERARLEGSSLRLADLRRAQLDHADLRHADLWRARLGGADLLQARLVGADLAEADLRKASLQRADLRRANLLHTVLDQARLPRARLDGAVLRGASMEGAEMELAQLSGAYFSQARMKGAQLFLADLRGAQFWKSDLRQAQFVLADLSRANLSHANLQEGDLSQADLTGADLTGADLRGVRLVFTRLDGARLLKADLRNAVLVGAQLKGADLRGSRLEGADLTDAWIDNANLAGIDLSSVRGLTREQAAIARTDRRTVLPRFVEGSR